MKSMNRADFNNKLIAKKGKKFVEENKELLDAQWDYINSLGDPADAIGKERDDLVISTAN